jgi:hypothetical protein
VKGTTLKFVALAVCAGFGSACGEVARQGQSPVQVVVNSLQAASGAEPDELAGTLLSDVVTNVTTPAPCTPTTPCPTIYDDPAEVTMSLALKDPGTPLTPSTPSALNQVTFTRYRVAYRRTDGRNTPGVDVPHAIDSALTFTVPSSGQATAGFEIVRHTAKKEAPLAALANNPTIIATIADVTFYGRDQAGHDVTASGSIGINFGNFGDPR